jgi:dTMP kinase
MSGGLIVLEGSDGTGKSSLCANLATRLQAERGNVVIESFPGRTSGTLGSVVYDIHHNSGTFGINGFDPTALQCLHIAAHLDAIATRILPAVNTGSLVILDRYWWSTFVYGIAGGANRSVIAKMIEAEVLAWDWLKPSALFLIDRDAPLREEPVQLWQRYRSEYLALAAREEANYPVHVISNNAAESDAMDQIIKLLACSI